MQCWCINVSGLANKFKEHLFCPNVRVTLLFLSSAWCLLEQSVCFVLWWCPMERKRAVRGRASRENSSFRVLEDCQAQTCQCPLHQKNTIRTCYRTAPSTRTELFKALWIKVWQLLHHLLKFPSVVRDYVKIEQLLFYKTESSLMKRIKAFKC